MRLIPTSREDARRRIILALDVPSVEEATTLAAELAGAVRFFKVGLELWSRGGHGLARDLIERGHDVFVDLKLHDIPNTVAGATAAVAELGATFVTLHGPPSAVRAAARARGGAPLKLLGVTVLTSMDEAEYRQAWGLAPGRTLADVVQDRAATLVGSGCDGLVASPLEAAALRVRYPDAIIVTPGVRPAGSSADDQARIATPREATRAGADYLVVGRPLRDARDRQAAAESLVEEAWSGFCDRDTVA